MAQIRKKFKEIQDNIALKTKEIQDLNDTITLKTQNHDELMQQHEALLLKISNDFPERKLKEKQQIYSIPESTPAASNSKMQ